MSRLAQLSNIAIGKVKFGLGLKLVVILHINDMTFTYKDQNHSIGNPKHYTNKKHISDYTLT
jgi:hypothetical protein